MAGPGAALICELCGKVGKNPGGHARHVNACRKRAMQKAALETLAGADPKQQTNTATNTTETKLPPAQPFDAWKTAEQGAATAEAVIDGASSVVEVIARMEAESVGIPDLIALVCLRALPPPLSDSEYRMLRVAYKDSNVQMPPWLLTIVITLAVLGPRAAMHPVIGPWLREKLVGTAADEPAPARPAPIVTPAPAPAPEPEPEQAPPHDAKEAKERIARALREAS